MKDVEKGSFHVVYTTPEGILKNKRWRQMLHGSVYKARLCAIAIDEAHVIKQWGTSHTSKMAPFRECYGRLHELRSLAPPVNMVAVTATATKETINTIIDVLQMREPHEIYESPEKPNITYVVEAIPPETNLQQCFGWLADELKIKGVESERTIIYCQTINQCGRIYTTLKALLGERFFTGKSGDNKNAIVEMLHSCSPTANKEAILKSFAELNGTIRILVATIAFGMGVDCKGVHRTIHFGPSKNLESFIQETGRAGRDGHLSTSYLLYNGLLLAHVDKDIKGYISNSGCRRKTLLKQFSSNQTSGSTNVQHLCCDHCAIDCKCETEQCKKPGLIQKASAKPPSKTGEVTKSQKELLNKNLILYHKSLIMKFMSEHAHGDIKYFTDLHLLVGFSELQINQVVKKCHQLFTINDICNEVEIWHIEHAFKIQNVISQVFGDISEVREEDWIDDNSELEDEIEHAFVQWTPLTEDQDFLDFILENLSMTSSVDGESNASMTEAVPNAVLDILENLSFSES